jgi:hypothetical protein
LAGHWVLFEAGWLHRDVSSSNVMAIEAEERPGVQEYVPIGRFNLTESLSYRRSFAVSREITQCTGMIVDGDLAIEWNNERRSRADHRSVRFAFCCLVEAHIGGIRSRVLCHSWLLAY